MHYLYTPLSINGAPFIAKAAIEEYDITRKRRAYNLQRIEMSELSRAQFSQMIGENREKYAYSSDTITVSQLFNLVKRYDKKFNPKPSSKAVNKDGTPKVVYHGTDVENITAFDLTKSGTNEGNTLGRGIYLTTSRGLAKSFGQNIYELYADIKNPFDMSEDGSLSKHYNTLDGKYNISKYYGEEYSKKKLDGSNYSAFDLLKSLAKKNNTDVSDILSELGFDGVHDGNEWVAFAENQIKSATDNIGTFDKSNPDIRYSASGNENYTKESLTEPMTKIVKDLEKVKLRDISDKFNINAAK